MAPRKMKRAASTEELSKVDELQDKAAENSKLAPKRGRGKTTKTIPKTDVIDENIEIQSESEDTEVTKVVKGRGKKKEPVSKSNDTAKPEKVKRGQQAAKYDEDDELVTVPKKRGRGIKYSKDSDNEQEDASKSNDEDDMVEEDIANIPKKKARGIKSTQESGDEEEVDVKAPKGKRGRPTKSNVKGEEVDSVLEGKEKKPLKGRAAKLPIEKEDEESEEENNIDDEEEEVVPVVKGKNTHQKKAEKVPMGKVGRRRKPAAETAEEEEEETMPVEPEDKKTGAKPKRGKAASAKPKKGKAASKEKEFVGLNGKELRVSIEH